jgi:hypothetical protein
MLHVRSISISCAVVCFFAVGIIGAMNGLSPEACCKRALLGAVVTHIAAGVAVRAINAILLQAMIDHQINKEQTGEDEV